MKNGLGQRGTEYQNSIPKWNAHVQLRMAQRRLDEITDYTGPHFNDEVNHLLGKIYDLAQECRAYINVAKEEL